MGSAWQPNLAELIIAAEASGDGGLEGLAGAAESVCQKLCRRLEALVTTVGSRALLARALRMSSNAFPFLSQVRAGTTAGSCLDGLSGSLRDVDIATARDGIEALYASLIGLLITFIGEPVTFRLLSEVWPEVHLTLAGTERQEA